MPKGVGYKTNSYVKTHSQVRASEKGVFGESNAAAVNKLHKPAEQCIRGSGPQGAAPSIPEGWPKSANVKHSRHQS